MNEYHHHDCDVIAVGYSDIAALTLQFCTNTKIDYFLINGNSDGKLKVYFDPTGEVAIPDYYHLEKTINERVFWVRVYDDENAILNERATGTVEIFTAGNSAIIRVNPEITEIEDVD